MVRTRYAVWESVHNMSVTQSGNRLKDLKALPKNNKVYPILEFKGMVKIVIELQAIILLLSCKNISSEEYQSSVIDSLTGIIAAQIDTTIVYNIDGVSLEGTQANVSYADGKIRYAEVMVYGETGQALIQYSFEESRINVIEKIYRYKTDLTEVKSKDDIELEARTEYSIDYQGKFLKNPKNDPLNIFSEFNGSVPFELRN